MGRSLFAFCSFLALATLVSAEEPRAPKARIELSSWNFLWDIVVTEDGSGSISYGSRAGDSARFPKGTVPFAPLLEAARTKPLAPAHGPTSVNVAIPNPGESTTIAVSRHLGEEWEAIGKLILARLQATNEERVADLLAKHPLIKDTTIKPHFEAPAEGAGRPPRPRSTPPKQ